MIGRNGIFIEPDVEFIDNYRKAGESANCAGNDECGYTRRPELTQAYARRLTEPRLNGHTYILYGEPLTHAECARHMNRAFDADPHYRPMSVEDCRADRVAELGDFIGSVIAGIYRSSRDGALDNPSDFTTAAGRLTLQSRTGSADMALARRRRPFAFLSGSPISLDRHMIGPNIWPDYGR
ncbi:hypothetical protein [Pikeienuella piscinae]|uniref:hypothetical protein n=1 Tax=Pikeienuella piscinae TaxID=2748098 RepID=UPI001BA5508B|nr:hypothetical protein [Pikeienuella piscinae]